jgi:hypothetical protein
MNSRALVEFPIVPLNVSNEELIRHITYEFPNLSGSLLLMFNRFCGNITGISYVGDEDCSCNPSQQDNVVTACPKCGTKLEIVE